MHSPFLPHLPAGRLAERYNAAKGNELNSGKMLSPESSSALVANAFGLFLDAPGRLPAIPGMEDMGWPCESVLPEACVRFPWRGGLHPWLDVLIETPTHLIGIESKRFEPFRSFGQGGFSTAFQRDVWGEHMAGFQAVRDAVAAIGELLPDEGTRQGRTANAYAGIDAAQLVKHALALYTQAGRRRPPKRPVLCYLHADPTHWPDGRDIDPHRRTLHSRGLAQFAAAVRADAVQFLTLTYSTLLDSWRAAEDPGLQAHAHAVRQAFGIR